MIKIHQALFGDKNGGYGLLKATCDTDLAKKIANYTDVHEQTPDGVRWNNALRGFSIDDYYLLMRTFVDPSAGVREGRVYTLCLIIPIGYLKDLDDLKGLLKYLPTDFNKDSEIVTPEFNPGGYRGTISTLRVNCLISSLLKSESDLVAWVDYEDYEDAICTIWNNIVPSLRSSLRFGLAFSIQESKALSGLKIFSVPSKLITKWQQNGIPVISTGDEMELTGEAEKSLAGGDSSRLLTDFIKNYGIQIKRIDDYLPIQKILQTVNEIGSADLNGQLTLLNTINVYNTKSTSINELKEKIADAIVVHLKKGSIKEVIRVRIENLRDLFPEPLFIKVVSELEACVVTFAKETPNNIDDLFENLIKPNVQEWWKKSVIGALKVFFNELNESSVRTILGLVEKSNNEDIGIVDDLIPLNAQEDLFVEVLGKGSFVNNYSVLEILAQRRQWFNLLALSLIKTKDLDQAIFIQNRIDPNHKNISAFNLIIESYPIADLLKTASVLHDLFITDLTVDLLLKRSEGLSFLDFNSSYSQELLLGLLKKGWDFFSYPEGKKLLYEMFDSIMEGKQHNEELLLMISQNSKAQILDYPQRSEIWKRLPLDTKNHFLTKTSAALLEQLSRNSTTPVPDDQILGEYIIQKGISDFLYFNSDNIKSVIPIVERFSLSDDILSVFIENYTGPLNAIEAKQLGQLINDKDYKRSAYAINEKASKNNNWRFGLGECCNLLGFMTVAGLVVSGTLSSVDIPPDQWWRAAEELIVELYPNGISLTTVWIKAGGKESDVIMNSTASIAWQDLLHKLRNNKFKGVSMNSLLKEINKRYDDNEKFKIVYKLKNNFI